MKTIQNHSHDMQIDMIGKRYFRLAGILITGIILALLFIMVIAIPINSIASVETSNLFRNQVFSPGPQLVVTKTHSSDFIIGQSGIYSILVKNVGDATATGPISVTDYLSSSLLYQPSGVSPWSCINVSQAVTCTHPNTGGLSASTSLPALLLNVKITDTGSTVITNTANSFNNGTFTDLNSDRTNLVGADLSVTKSVQPASVVDGGLIAYKIVVINNGPSPAEHITLTENLPSQITFNAYTVTKGSYASNKWTIANLADAEPATFLITGTVKDGTCGKITNTTAGLVSAVNDFNPSNNQASATVNVENTCLHGLVTNASSGTPIQSASMRVKDSASHIYNTTTSASGWYTFSDTTSQPLAVGNAVITATKTYYKTGVETKNLLAGVLNRQDFQLQPAVDLRISKTNNKYTVVPGETFSYTINISNTGILTASQVVISDTWSDALNFVRDSLVGQFGVISKTINSTRIWTLTNGLKPGEGKLFTMRTSVDSPLSSGTLRVTNTVRTSTSAIEQDKSNNYARDVDYTPNPSVSKSVSPSQANANSRFTFTIKVTNNGEVDMTSVVVNDTFNSYLTYYSGSVSQGSYSYNTSTRTFSANLGTINPGGTATVTIIMTVNTSVSTTTTLSNSAGVTYYHGSVSQSKDSNSVSYRILGTTSLPGTGGAPIMETDRSVKGALWVTIFVSVLLGIAGLTMIVYGRLAKKRQSSWAGWTTRMGVLLVGAGLVFGVAAWGISQVSGGRTTASQPTILPPVEETAAIPAQPAQLMDSLYTFQDHETLPDYPVPTPTLVPASEAEQPQDTTSPNRILIPSLGVDAIIKYVPFDGYSWLISGLQNEIAWMGDTSWPGLGGNTGLAGHVTLRNGADGPFRYLETLNPGDEITIFTDQNVYHYRVRELNVVEDSDMSVVKPTEDTRLSLITCTGWDEEFGHFLKRLIVIADLNSVNPIKTSSN